MARWIKSGCQVGERCAHAQQNHKTDVSAHAHTGVPMHSRRVTCSALHSARTGRQIPQVGNQLRKGDRELPYTPKQRTNLIAWLAARSDGQNYGKLLLYNFPKERLIYGPEQIEARINQDPIISQQISLWNRQGSRVIQGNLLIVPIEQSLLYVEPIYLEATQNSLPTLVRVVVAYENRIIMAQTLEQALQGIFQPELAPASPIIRPLEDEIPAG